MRKPMLALSAVLVTAAAFAARIEVSQDHPDALYRTGEETVFTVTVKGDDGALLRTGAAKWKLDNFGTEQLGAGRTDLAKENPFVVRGTMKAEGFLRLTVNADTNRVVWGVGYDVGKIRQDEPCPWDFDAYWYHDVMLGINRAVDWVCARPDVDLGQVTYTGSSQGGGFGLFLNYLNGHFTKAVVAVCAITGHYGYKQGRQPGWPNLVNSQAAAKRDAAAVHAAYFDGVNFAARIRHPIRFIVGFADTTCPPADVYAAYNACPSADKAILNAVGSGHSWGRWYVQHKGEPGCPDVDAWLRTK